MHQHERNTQSGGTPTFPNPTLHTSRGHKSERPGTTLRFWFSRLGCTDKAMYPEINGGSIDGFNCFSIGFVYASADFWHMDIHSCDLASPRIGGSNDGLATGLEEVIVSPNLRDNGRQPSRLISWVDVSLDPYEEC